MQTCPFNALTIDVEEWFHVCAPGREPGVANGQWRVRQNLDKLLRLLAGHGVRATFFVLGCVARALPEIAPQIAAAGHEIASHGYSHRLVSELEPQAFRDELRLTRDSLQSQCGDEIVGFRAPRWSITPAMPWAFEILRDEGYLYDSSMTPLPFVGNPAGPRTPHRIITAGGTLWEIPPMVTPSPFGNLPTGGGWGLRFFPRRMVHKTIGDLNRAGAPAVIFLHPRELDPSGPRLDLGVFRTFVTYGPRTDVTGRVDDLLRRFRFVTMREMVEKWESV